MATIFMFVGDTGPSILDTLNETKVDGTVGPIDLTGASVTFHMRSLFSEASLISAAATVVGPAVNGAVRYDWTLLDTTTTISSRPGPYKGWWVINFGAGVIVTVPEFNVQFMDHAPRRITGPCTDWCSSADVVACYPTAAQGECLSSSVKMASELLFQMTARQFPGWCQSTIRPCARGGCWGLGTQFLSRGHVVWSGHEWNTDDCSCGGWLQKVTLPGIAQGVVEVIISGVVLAPSAYRLDPDNSLIRLDGGAWPICQNMAVAGDGPGAFQVIYAHGYDPPELGRRAAAQLAYQFFLACAGQACQLPSGVVQIVRQGISITRAANLFKDGATGLAMVDSFITAFGGQSTTIVMSPEVNPTDRRTQ